MPVKRAAKRTARASSSYDRSKFVSVAAENRCKDTLVAKPIIPERGFTCSTSDFVRLYRNIQQRQWEKFASHPQSAVGDLVREFYANVPEAGDDGRVYVRGQWVPFHRMAINEYFGTPPIDSDDYTRLVVGDTDMDEVLRVIAKEGAQWESTSKGLLRLARKDLDNLANLWHYFIAATLMPTAHLSDITRERAILLYVVLEGLTLDIGTFIYAAIRSVMQCNASSLWYPSLITQLCIRAGVRFESTEELILMKEPIHDTRARQLMGIAYPGRRPREQSRPREHHRASTSSAAPPSPPPQQQQYYEPPHQPDTDQTDRLQRIEDRLEKLEMNQTSIWREMRRNNRYMEQLMAHLQVPQPPPEDEDMDAGDD